MTDEALNLWAKVRPFMVTGSWAGMTADEDASINAFIDAMDDAEDRAGSIREPDAGTVTAEDAERAVELYYGNMVPTDEEAEDYRSGMREVLSDFLKRRSTSAGRGTDSVLTPTERTDGA